jgi:hypothetical protein
MQTQHHESEYVKRKEKKKRNMAKLDQCCSPMGVEMMQPLLMLMMGDECRPRMGSKVDQNQQNFQGQLS